MFLNLQWHTFETVIKLHFVVFYIVTVLQYKPNRNLLLQLRDRPQPGNKFSKFSSWLLHNLDKILLICSNKPHELVKTVLNPKK